jgi:hypothetical protein
MERAQYNNMERAMLDLVTLLEKDIMPTFMKSRRRPTSYVCSQGFLVLIHTNGVGWCASRSLSLANNCPMIILGVYVIWNHELYVKDVFANCLELLV